MKLQLQLAERAAGEEPRRASFAKLHGWLDRATHLVRRLLSAARLEDGAGELPSAPVDLLQLAQACVGERYEQAEVRRIDLGIVETTAEGAAGGVGANASASAPDRCRATRTTWPS